MAYEAYATDVLRSQTTKLYTLPMLGIRALDPDYNVNHVEIMTHLVFEDENIIEQAKETYRIVLEKDIERRFVPNNTIKYYHI